MSYIVYKFACISPKPEIETSPFQPELVSSGFFTFLVFEAADGNMFESPERSPIEKKSLSWIIGRRGEKNFFAYLGENFYPRP